MIENMKTLERLYLSKQEGGEIYIDICNLPQHQIDGVRFIYRQFIKKNKGVIINDPPGYGKLVQVVLFLGATRKLLSQSILILCSETKADNWLQHFQKWTSFDDNETFIESFNPNRKKMLICINSMKNIEQFSKRTWSVVVIDDSENTKHILKTKFNTNFKIWITSEDMKENLKVFSKINNWLKPNDGFIENDFIPDKRNLEDVLTKSILLDAYMQDVVLRRNGLTTPLNEEKTSTVFQSKLSRKNKDTTGTKIKRSKTIESERTNEINKDNPNDNSVKNPKIDLNVMKEVNEEEMTEMDVETVVSQEKPIVLETFEKLQNVDNHENTKYSEISQVTDGKSFDSDTRTEFDNSGNSSKYTKGDSNKLNKLSTTVKKATENEEIEIKINAMKSQTDNKMNLTDDVKENDTIDEKNNKMSSGLVETKSVNKSYETIDVIMKEMEEKTMKKFKGSLLDDIF